MMRGWYTWLRGMLTLGSGGGWRPSRHVSFKDKPWGLRGHNLAALRILSRELNLGPVPVESHGRSHLGMLGGIVLRDGMIDKSYTADVVSRINTRLEQLHGEGKFGVIGALHYAASVLIRGEA